MRVLLLLCLLIGTLSAKGGRLASSTRTGSRSTLIHNPWRPHPTPSSSGSSGSIRTSGEAGGTSILSGPDAGGESIGGDDIFGKSISDDDDESEESMESDEFDDSDEMTEHMAEENRQAATIEEQVSSLRNETQNKKQTLTRLEAFFEELERRILRLEAANNETRGVTESVHESMTSPAPETTTNLPCCQKIKLKSRKTNSGLHPFLGVYQKIDTEDYSTGGLFYSKFYDPEEVEDIFQGADEILSNKCENELAGFYSPFDDKCEEAKFKFVSGFTGSCITGPKLYTVQWYNEGQEIWDEDDSLTIVCVD